MRRVWRRKVSLRARRHGLLPLSPDGLGLCNPHPTLQTRPPSSRTITWNLGKTERIAEMRLPHAAGTQLGPQFLSFSPASRVLVRTADSEGFPWRAARIQDHGQRPGLASVHVWALGAAESMSHVGGRVHGELPALLSAGQVRAAWGGIVKAR